MLNLVRKHCFAMAIGILLWQGWSRSQPAEPVAADDGDPLPAPQRIEPEDVPQRLASMRPADMKDPFFLAELLKMQAENEAAQSDNAYTGTSSNGVPTSVDVSAGPGVPVLRVVLQSTMHGDGGRAWINGFDLGIGDVVPVADAEEPPVLLEVGGTGVVLQWRGKRFRIDLDGAEPVEVEELR